MSTQTQTAVTQRARRTVAPSRAYDHLYDSVYQVSGAGTHNRNHAVAINTRTVQVPSAGNMFSELTHYPRDATFVRNDDPVPAGITRNFHQRMLDTQRRGASDYARAEPTGADRYRFAGRPRNPGLRDDMPNVVLSELNNRLDPITANKLAAADAGAIASGGGSRTVGTQSDYRESETQTDPWTAPYTLRPGSAPEVLTLQSLSYGLGLPAGLNEVIMIERARAKRAWEKTLPEVVDEKSAERRIKMMEEQDAQEWKWREEEIEEIQRERLLLVQKLVAERAKEDHAHKQQKVEEIFARRREEWEVKEDVSYQERLRELRKLQRQRDSVEPAKADSSAVAAYTNPMSEVYAPVAREGAHARDAAGERLRVQSQYSSTYGGLLELEATLPTELTNPRIVRPPKHSKSKGGSQHAEDRYQTTLESVLLNLKVPKDKTEKPLRFQKRIPTPPKRGPVKEVEVPQEGADARFQAALLLQRIVRGRAEQATMYEGKDRRKELIAELRTTHALQKAQQDMKLEEQQYVTMLQGEAQSAVDSEAAKLSALSEVAGEHAGQMLDFLGKELVRLQEERRIHAFAKLAERTRRMREAAEAGLRQKEEARRKKSDEIFRQIIGVHQESVDTYLEDIVCSAQSSAADEIARVEIRQKAAEVDRVAQELYESGMDQTENCAMTVSAELVSQFLLPEADKVAVRAKIKSKQKSLQVAAHKELVEAAAKMDSSVSSEAQRRKSASAGRRRSRSSQQLRAVKEAESEISPHETKE
eukprot:m.440173 g.440173  ORF g.440173 m.440173 type:complete len:759 (-) comp18475_c0_seq1:82-2358(-)